MYYILYAHLENSLELIGGKTSAYLVSKLRNIWR